MNYPYENLDPERFQEFCQALITKEFPDTTCYPVGQPDGGRDAISYTYDASKKGFIVFQVKFVRNPSSKSDINEWLNTILKAEKPKIEILIKSGAKKYILITNIPGTSHHLTGTIDQSVEQLSNLEIPSICWFRDDLNRRLDNAWNLKWVYPELMTGPDLIRAIIEPGLTESSERRSVAIRAFIRDQYQKEEDVRFKQIDLQHKLLDLFIDVPITLPHNSSSKKQQREIEMVIRSVARKYRPNNSIASEYDWDEVMVYDREERFFAMKGGINIGAATLLLNPFLQDYAPKIVLEGAPGQGKSTITQYLCQIHRMRLLKNDEGLRSIPEVHRQAPIRLPIKVDLRDLATWLSKRDPFSSENSEQAPRNWQKTLESFIAGLIQFHAGGVDFSISDLLAVVRISSILIVFDGLDEIADISKRQEVVNEILNGVNRLEENCSSLQVVVTSRPAAFANSPGLPEDKFPYFQLGSVPRKLIDEYTTKWIRARKLQQAEGNEVKRILKDKLDQVHIRELSRNPMQLAILMSLIHTKGSSLPDKRTALYDSYVELFFNREAEKSPIVREHRELLINIHRYLAWLLQTETELGNTTGSITQDRLHKVLSDYLSVEGYDPSLAKTLFTGMVERVVALVSRVEGTYEFEVQPLREYFAARYLYETAPYSPPGNEKRGTKPDRFDAIARNFYWLNVTRFYAGCYSKGELPSLIDSLQELINEEGFNLISHPRTLAATLLSDWVFTQHPKSVKEVVKLILDGLGVRYVLSSNGRRLRGGNPLILPKNCGKDELISYCFSLLKNNQPRDYCLDIIDLINGNGSYDDVIPFWYENVRSSKDINRTRWLEYGLYLGVLSKIPINDLRNLLSDEKIDTKRLSLLYRSRRFDFLEATEETFNKTVEAILSMDFLTLPHQRPVSILDFFGLVLTSSRYSVSLQVSRPMSLKEAWEREAWKFENQFNNADTTKATIRNNPSFPYVDKCNELIRIAEVESEKSCEDWATSLDPWDNLIEAGRSVWGDRWAFFYLANISSGIKSQFETCTDSPNLFDYTKSLCRRVRYARLRAGNATWWLKQLDSSTSELDRMLWLLILLTWGSTKTLFQLLSEIDQVIESLSEENWQRLYDSFTLNFPFSNTLVNKSIDIDQKLLPTKISYRSIPLLGFRSKSPEILYDQYLRDYQENDPILLAFCQKNAIKLFINKKVNWVCIKKVIQESYLKGAIYNSYSFYELTRNIESDVLPLDIAKEISSSPDLYPTFLVNLAEEVCRENIAYTIVPVGRIAQRDNWFST